MRKILCILRHETKMQMARPAGWGVFLIALALSLLDDLPTGGNLHRLEFLTDPVYFVARTMSLHGLTLAFGLVILLSDRLALDGRTGVKALIMAGPTTRAQYLLGKLLGGFVYCVSMFALFLAANAAAYALAAPFPVPIGRLAATGIKTAILCVLPVSVFIGSASVSLPALMDVRLFYALAAVLFVVNSSVTGTAGPMPFYCITSGDLIKLIWQHPKWPYVSAGSVAANLVFLLGGGLLATPGPFLKKRFWGQA